VGGFNFYEGVNSGGNYFLVLAAFTNFTHFLAMFACEFSSSTI